MVQSNASATNNWLKHLMNQGAAVSTEDVKTVRDRRRDRGAVPSARRRVCGAAGFPLCSVSDEAGDCGDRCGGNRVRGPAGGGAADTAGAHGAACASV